MNTDDKTELTEEEKEVLNELPDDAVDHWLDGEKWDFAKGKWIKAKPLDEGIL